MHPDIDLVIQLQTLDQKITALEKEIASLPKQLAALEKTLESHVRKLEADQAAQAANQKERKKLEGEIQVHQQKISKLRDQMLGAKTNEQYRAFQHEIEYIEKEIRTAEDRILELMTESEPLDAERSRRLRRRSTKRSSQVEAEKTRTRERTAQDQAEMDQVRRPARGNRQEDPRPHRERLHPYPQEVERRRGRRGSRQRTVHGLPDHIASAARAGLAQRRPRDAVRKLRALPVLQSPGECGGRGYGKVAPPVRQVVNLRPIVNRPVRVSATKRMGPTA